MYNTSQVTDIYSMPALAQPPSYEETMRQYGPTRPPPIPPRAAELGDGKSTDLNDNCKSVNATNHSLARIPTITVTSAPPSPESPDHVININDFPDDEESDDEEYEAPDFDELFNIGVREPADGQDSEQRDGDGNDDQPEPDPTQDTHIDVTLNVNPPLDKRVSWSGEYIEGQRSNLTQVEGQESDGAEDLPLRHHHHHHHRHHRRKLSSVYAKASVGHSLTFPPAYEEFAQYSYQNGVLFNPADLHDEGDDKSSCKKSRNIYQQNSQKYTPGKVEQYYYSMSQKKEEAIPRVQVSLQRLPPPGQIRLAASQPKDIAQYQRKDWTEDEFILETPVCGIISIVSHVGALVWFAVLIWQLRMRDIFEAQKWEVIGNGWYTRRVDFTDEFDKTMLIIAGVFLGLSYATILFESMASYAETYLSNFMSFQEAMDHVRHVRRVPSKITWRLECYIQDELNPMPSYTKLEDGQAVTRARDKTHHTRHWVTYELPVTRCIDMSGEIKGFRPGVVSRVEFSKTFGFVDEKAAMQYEILKREFLSRHPNRVPEAKVEETLEIEGFKDRITVFFQSDGRPPYMKKRYFWLCTFLLLGWPYRWWFRNNTEMCRFTYVKLVELGEFVDR